MRLLAIISHPGNYPEAIISGQNPEKYWTEGWDLIQCELKLGKSNETLEEIYRLAHSADPENQNLAMALQDLLREFLFLGVRIGLRRGSNKIFEHIFSKLDEMDGGITEHLAD